MKIEPDNDILEIQRLIEDANRGTETGEDTPAFWTLHMLLCWYIHSIRVLGNRVVHMDLDEYLEWSESDGGRRWCIFEEDNNTNKVKIS